MRKPVAALSLAVVFALWSPFAALAHSGDLDAKGGHYDRQSGKYHYHRAPFIGQSPPARSTPARAAPLMPSQSEQEQHEAGVADEVKKLDDLYEQGLLSREEYEQRKEELLR